MSVKYTDADLERAHKVMVEDWCWSEASFGSFGEDLAQALADMRAGERERCARMCEKRCANRVTGAVLAGLIRGGNEP